MEILEAPIDPDAVEARLKALAERHARASNVGIQVLNVIGGQAESLLNRLPSGVRNQLAERTDQALTMSMEAAHRSRGVVEVTPSWMGRALTTAMGAAGGMGGLPTALAELPVTVTVLLRTIQDVAVEHGFDPAEPGVQYDCIQVFAAAGPLDHDDGSDLAFLSTRMAVTGTAKGEATSSRMPRSIRSWERTAHCSA